MIPEVTKGQNFSSLYAGDKLQKVTIPEKTKNIIGKDEVTGSNPVISSTTKTADSTRESAVLFCSNSLFKNGLIFTKDIQKDKPPPFQPVCTLFYLALYGIIFLPPAIPF